MASVSDAAYPPIADYAIIGDCRAAALISRGGSLDWLCLPRFDSPTVFAALLDRQRGGRFVICPAVPHTSERRYLPDTNVLETVFTADTGRVRLLDLMPVAPERDKGAELWPDHQVLRRVECLDGEVDVEVTCDPRPAYACGVPAFQDRGPLGFCYQHGADALMIRSEIPLAPSAERPGLRGRAALRRGERRYLSLVSAHGEPAVLPAFGDAAQRKIDSTVRWWRDWAARCEYRGPYRDLVVRSALVLKLMTYAPSGAVVAAPTTSLPEQLGGVRNWDYRYCWLRDASLTLQALVDLGYPEDAEAFLAWMLHSTRLTWPELQVLYDVHGETRLRERALEHLAGYGGSRPVRVGNAAAGQLQLDIYGEVVDAAFEFVRRGGRLDGRTARLLVGLGRTACRRWREPDEGIWEIRAGRRHHTYSKAMCWVALDRLLMLHQWGHVRVPVERFRRERQAIHAEIERHGYNRRIQSYVSVFDGEEVDASLLLLARYGYAPPDAEPMLGTCRRVHDQLGENGLMHRYRSGDGLPGGEGAFGICSFWAVDCACRQAAVDEAARTFEHVCSFANDVGLLAEEIDPSSGALLGNFPQAFTHVGLIDAALALGERTGHAARRPMRGGEPGNSGELVG